MKNTIIGIAVLAIFLAASNGGSNKANESESKNNDTTETKSSAKIEDTKDTAPLKEIVNSYF